jgi:predicted kinase
VNKVIFLAGLPAAGKSTVARQIAIKHGGKVLDIDEIKRKLSDPTLVSSTIDPPEIRWKCYVEAARQIFQFFKNGEHTVIVDEVFHLNELREKLEGLLVAQKVEVVWIEVVCSFEEVEKRLKRKSRVGHILSTDEALKMNLLFREIFEPFPENKNNHSVFSNDTGSDG